MNDIIKKIFLSLHFFYHIFFLVNSQIVTFNVYIYIYMKLKKKSFSHDSFSREKKAQEPLTIYILIAKLKFAIKSRPYNQGKE